MRIGLLRFLKHALSFTRFERLYKSKTAVSVGSLFKLPINISSIQMKIDQDFCQFLSNAVLSETFCDWMSSKFF